MRTPNRAFGLAAIALALAACGSTASTQLGTIGEAAANIVADDLAFDRATLEVPAGLSVTLVFENRESAPHNVAIYADDSAGEAVFVGEVFGGPGFREYALPALAPGSYLFRCDVHQEMRGTLVATP
ncbi:MAG: cupredoxin domain-containing protein [Chloroflexi bacterium]|nr:cupredoxin domain-containing protein [Chloroflexota bacterium]